MRGVPVEAGVGRDEQHHVILVQIPDRCPHSTTNDSHSPRTYHCMHLPLTGESSRSS